jgi:hypothetical protein
LVVELPDTSAIVLVTETETVGDNEATPVFVDIPILTVDDIVALGESEGKGELESVDVVDADVVNETVGERDAD